MTWDHPIPEAALSQHLAIVAKTGAGKTYTAKGLVERLLGQGRRVVVIDPTGVWWGLRSSSDGASPGFPVVVFGGDHADVPITDKAGAKLAELLADASRAMPAVIDLSDFTNAGRQRFMTEFAAALYRLNRAALHLVIDEADEFAPQRPLPEAKRMFGEIDRIVRRGRARGFRVIMITQRPAVLHKDVLTQAGTLVALRMTAPQDRKAIEAWVDGHGDKAAGKTVLASLARQNIGQGWVWAPDHDMLEQVTFPEITTLDSSAAPEEGDAPREAAVLADVDLAGLADLLQVEEEPKPGKKGDSATVKQLRENVADQQDQIRRLEAELTRVLGIVGEIGGLVAGISEDKTVAHPKARPAADLPVMNKPPAPRKLATAPDGLPSGAGKLLDVLLAHHPARLTWTQTATLAGVKARGGHFNANRKALRESGLIEEAGSDLAASDEAIAKFGNARPAPKTQHEVLAMWTTSLPSPASEMIGWLFKQGQDWSAKTVMAEALGKAPRGGHWNNGLATLRRNNLIEESGDRLRAAAIFFGVTD